MKKEAESKEWVSFNFAFPLSLTPQLASSLTFLHAFISVITLHFELLSFLYIIYNIIGSHIDFIRDCVIVIFKLERLFYLSKKFFGLVSLIELRYISFVISLRTDR